MLNFRMRTLAALAFMIAGFVQALALDLPVRTVGGRQYYVYKVHPHDNVYGVANLLGLTRDDIINNNPAAAQGLKEGQELFFPVEKYGAQEKAPVADEPMKVKKYKVKKGDTAFGISRKFNTTPEVLYKLNPGAENGIKAGSTLNVPADGKSAKAVADKPSGDTQIRISDVTEADAEKAREDLQQVADATGEAAPAADNAAAAEDKEYTVVVMLPFMLEDDASRVAAQATEFYKGMLVAAEKFKDRAPKLKIIAVDTGNSTSVVRELLDTDRRLKEADVIIAPENREQLDMVAEFGKANKVYVLNVANSRDGVYLTNPYVLQGLIPSQQMLEKAGRLPDAVVACVGGGSNAIGSFYHFIDDPAVRLIGVEAAGRGIDTLETAATISTGRLGIFHGMKSYFCQDEYGQIAPVYSISAGLDYPGVGPEHAYLHDIGRAEYVAITDEEAVQAFEYLARTEGIIPAIESAHAVAYARKLAPTMGSEQLLVVTISGRGDKDCAAIARYRGEDLHE